jgi:hypothetical protein
MLFGLGAVAALAIGQDALCAFLTITSFYWSESLLYKVYLLLFIPMTGFVGKLDIQSLALTFGPDFKDKESDGYLNELDDYSASTLDIRIWSHLELISRN